MNAHNIVEVTTEGSYKRIYISNYPRPQVNAIILPTVHLRTKRMPGAVINEFEIIKHQKDPEFELFG